MRKYLWLVLGGSLAAVAQISPIPRAFDPTGDRLGDYVLVRSTNLPTKIDLEFPGGTPKDLAKAIETASHKPLNMIIPEEGAAVRLPAISVKQVTVPQIFESLEANSPHDERWVWKAFTSLKNETVTAPVTYHNQRISYGFKTGDNPPNDHSVWYFNFNGEPVQIEPRICQFYQLSPYLEAGYKAEDLIAVINTGWKMLGAVKMPELSYSKDTKLLIAVGETDKVKMIGDMLLELPAGKSR